MVTTGEFAEQVMTLVEAARWLEVRFGRRPNVATLWRWATRGIRGIRLGTIALGRYRYTTERALERFIADTSAVERQRCSTEQVSPETAGDGATAFTTAEVAAARQRREAAKEKAKEFLRLNLGSERRRGPRRA